MGYEKPACEWAEGRTGMKLFSNIPIHHEDVEYVETVRYVAGISYADNHGDQYQIVVIDSNNKRVVDVQVLRNIELMRAKDAIAPILKKWNVSLAWCEVFGFQSYLCEQLQMEGLPVKPFKITNRSKTPLIENLAKAFHLEELHALDDYKLLHELNSLEMEIVQNSTGQHQYKFYGAYGLVMACALAWYGIRGGFRVDFA